MARNMSVIEVAKHHRISWDQAWQMELAYMRDVLGRNPMPEKIRAIGIDEISVRKGHEYRIVVADLDEMRPIWFGGNGRTKEDMDLFYDEIGKTRAESIEIAVMDMWKPFRKSLGENAEQAAIVFDKFHVLMHLSRAMDDVRREEYKRVDSGERKFIKGQRYTLLANSENLDADGRLSLKLLLSANKRLNTAYLLRESFSQLWTYTYPASARKFFENWRDSLRWQKLAPFEKFAKMVDKHWDGIVSYCKPTNKVSLGFMEGMNNKIRVIQRRAYGIKNEEYLRLKVLTAFIPEDRL